MYYCHISSGVSGGGLGGVGGGLGTRVVVWAGGVWESSPVLVVGQFLKPHLLKICSSDETVSPSRSEFLRT